MDLTTRVLEGELMDAPDLDAADHQRALRGLERVNLLSGTARTVVNFLLPTLSTPIARPWRVLDLACGGGDVTLQIGARLIQAGVDIEVHGWDRSPTAIEHSQANLTRMPQLVTKANAFQFQQRDLFDQTVDWLAESRGHYDVIMCTLFLHHLDRAEALELLSRAYANTGSMVLIDDLRRTWLGYRLAQLGCQVLTRSPIVHVDGPLSVRAAFTVEELRELSRAAGLPTPSIRLHWPQRFLACWQRSAS